MNRSLPHSFQRMSLRLPATALVLLAACGGGGDSGAGDTAAAAAAPMPAARTDTVVPPPAPPLTPPPPARDADQAFLRHMLDHHETTLALVHEQMSAPAGHAEHGGASDPTEFDVVLDAEKLEMLRLLESLYDEKYSPRVLAHRALARDGAPIPHREGEAPTAHATEAPATDLPALLRAGAKAAQEAEPRLSRDPVRALARRIGASQLALVRRAGTADSTAH